MQVCIYHNLTYSVLYTSLLADSLCTLFRVIPIQPEPVAKLDHGIIASSVVVDFQNITRPALLGAGLGPNEH